MGRTAKEWAEIVRKAGQAGGKARAAALTPEERTQAAARAGKVGGTARAKKMTKAERSESARKAALARWGTAKKGGSK
jgi:hypothetical protein